MRHPVRVVVRYCQKKWYLTLGLQQSARESGMCEYIEPQLGEIISDGAKVIY